MLWCKYVANGSESDEEVAVMSERMVLKSANKSKAKWEASLERVACKSSLDGMFVAVVSHNPGSCGETRSGRWEMEVGIGICRETEKCLVSST